MLVGKPGHVTGERPGSGKDGAGLEVVGDASHTLNNAFTPTQSQILWDGGTHWHCVQVLNHSRRCFHVRKQWCCLSGVVQQEIVRHVKSFACYLFCLVDFQLIHVHNMVAQKKMLTVSDTCIW